MSFMTLYMSLERFGCFVLFTWQMPNLKFELNYKMQVIYNLRFGGIIFTWYMPNSNFEYYYKVHIIYNKRSGCSVYIINLVDAKFNI